MPKYRLVYFHARGRAEISRLIFAAAGVDYEDVRYTGDEWKAQKGTGKYPFGQLPCLEIDDGQVVLGQSRAIARYLASEFDFYGNTNLEKGKMDMIYDACDDMMQAIVKVNHAKNEDERAIKWTERREKESVVLEGLEKILVANNGGDGYFVGDRLSLADLSFYAQMQYNLWGGPILDDFPKLRALHARIAALPRIAAWLEKRPVTGH